MKDARPVVHICAPSPESVRLVRVRCPTCERRTYFVASTYEWYAGDMTCLACGDSWNEDGRAVHPFERGWRGKSIAAARRFYRRYRGLTGGRP
ncbi:MAG: hypothetical protein V3V96_17455 [Acidiferrobacterales bacterium]